jgi:DNA-binding transcriptional regulator YiaG
MQDHRTIKGSPRNRRHRDHDAQHFPVRENGRVGRSVKGDTFYLTGEEITKPYRYTMCRLDNIFLLNGYEMRKYDGEVYISITDVDGLHYAIGRHLVTRRKYLRPKEIKFLRDSLALTQAGLAAKLGNDAQSVARWEKGECAMPGTADKLLRVVFLAENTTRDDNLILIRKLLTSVLKELDEMDEIKTPQASFRFSDGWDEASKRAA